MADLHKAIRALTNAVTIAGDTQETIEAFDADGNQINIDWTQVNSWIDPEQYKVDRVYPNIQDQLDMQYWDSINGTTVWVDTISKIKTDNPKPND